MCDFAQKKTKANMSNF